MSELKYDPELPFAFISTANREVARFADREIAARFGKEIAVGSVVDTTPKPKIPEGAEFIYWDNGDGKVVAVRENYNPLKPWAIDGLYFDEADLIERFIGDAEVTVLVRKEET